MSNEKPNIGGEYKYGFKDKDVSIVKTPKGINEDIVKEISTLKNEPSFMTEYRLKSLKEFETHHQPSFGPSLDFCNSKTTLTLQEHQMALKAIGKKFQKLSKTPLTN